MVGDLRSDCAGLIKALETVYALRLETISPFGRQWLGRVAYRLTVDLETCFRGAPPATPEQMALARLKELGAELNVAASALQVAADAIRNGQATPQAALHAHQASRRARAAAEGMAR